MRYAVVDGSDVYITARCLAEAERELQFFSMRYGLNCLRIVALGDNLDAAAQLHRQLATRTPREAM